MDLDFLPFSLAGTPLRHVGGLPFPKVSEGKVREVFDLGDAYLLVATDRVSAFDVVLEQGVPGKGELLTAISLFWFERAARRIPGLRHHLVGGHGERLAAVAEDHPELAHRSMVVRKLRPLPLEAVVRGYLSGSGWKTYRETGKLFEHELPAGLREGDRLPTPLFTPTTKASTGHDEPLTADEAAGLVGRECFDAVRDRSLELYAMGVERAEAAGLILADTKFEFGRDAAGELYLIDEVLTPDSSRYWSAEAYAPGGPQPSFDKQFVRDYLESVDWDKAPPPPALPERVIRGTRERYVEAYRRIVAGQR